MSYNITLEELLNQLNQNHSPNPYQQRYRQYQQQQQQQQQQQRQAAAAIAAERKRQAIALQRQREAAAARAYAASFANHPLFQNGLFYGGYDDEEDEDEEEEPYYSYYYNQPYQRSRPQRQSIYFQPVNGPAISARTAAPATPTAPIAPVVRRTYPKQDQTEGNPFDLADLLNFLAGNAPESDAKKEEEADEPITTKDSEADNATIPEVEADVETAEVPKAAIEAESKEQEQAQKPEPEPEQIFIPNLKRHTTLTREDSDPEPKIEISSRNFKNETLPYSPQTNVYDLANEYVTVLAIPGANLKDLHIDFHAATNELVVKGEIPSPFATEDLKQIKNLEIRSGSIERRIKFPNLPKIQEDDIKANYLNGLLTVRIPKQKDDGLVKAKKKVTIEDVPDDELTFESNPANFVTASN
ncbi:hypothetical protein WICPIJ_003635 [Wickerhamomyces pijperi]|uniref:SHSP domain-containing protein n=1 Tax=Wickerhamomyces pijperi TaxID=599730 RepID=A0A9P8Q6S7_WICPI|nr:hypothetical protein WICPIJ_003635 [Wickerhamomyces pijperi]